MLAVILWAMTCHHMAMAQTTITPSNNNIHYSGRIDLSDPTTPKLYYGGSYITTTFTGTSLRAVISDQSWSGANYVGFIIDGGNQIVRSVHHSEGRKKVTVATGLSNTRHTLVMVKRTAAFNGFLAIHAFELDNGKSIAAPNNRPSRRIALYGDSVTEGTNAGNTQNTDEGGRPAEDGWSTYGNSLARRLNAEVHNNGLAGLAVMDGTGFHSSAGGPIGLETTYTKLGPTLGNFSNWNFNRYSPHLVIMALGINDEGFISGSEERGWINKYKQIINDLRNNRHPNADFVLTVPPLGYERTRMEGLVRQVVNEINNPNVHYFNLTVPVPPNHPNSESHNRMANQLYNFVQTLDINWGGNGGSGGDPITEGAVEIEDNFTVLNDVGSNGSVGSDDFNPLASNGLHVRLFDVNDEISTRFTVGESGNYRITLRLRTGEQVGTPTNLANQYQIRVNGTVRNFALVSNSTSALDKDTYWGDVAFTQNLSQGSHTVRIKATRSWLKADKLTFKKVNGSNPPNNCNVVVRASGQTGEEIMRLLIDGQVAKEWAVTNTNFANYTTTVSRGGNIRVAFVNDGNTASGADKNLIVDKITFGGVTRQSENVTRVGCGENEWLFCNGHFDYGNLTCESTRTGSLNQNPSASPHLITYPNPVTEGLVWVNGPSNDYAVKLYDLRGKQVFVQSSLFGTESIRVGHLPKGTYVLKIASVGATEHPTTAKIILD